ncbi:hypothetical protein, partial [Actinomadura logoneensis]|uniref:hypothetical protein n=1 Tax=Actinomadura logoneensis TaxID=2293572 RepID=UPI0018F1542A
MKALAAAALAGERAWVHELYAQVVRLTADPGPLAVAAACEGMAWTLAGRQHEARRMAATALDRLPAPDGTAGAALHDSIPGA